MVDFSWLKMVLGSSPCRRNAGNFVNDLGIAFRVSGCLNARAFSSVEDVETCNGQNQVKLKLDSVHSLLNEYGFTPEQVSKISKSYPLVFSVSVKTLSPKFRFLRSILGSDFDVTRVVTANPRLIASSLKNQLKPNYEFIQSILHQDELVAKCIKRTSRILLLGLDDNLAAKVYFLRESGIPCTSIAKLMEYSPGILALSFPRLKESLKKAMSFGFEPSNPMIVSAIRAISQINESTWDRKVELYRKWGWSIDDFFLAFKKQPFVMCVSEEKINKGMDVFLNRIGLSSSDIAKYPNIIFFNVEERIIPRCSIVALLLSKGVLGDRSSIISTYYAALGVSEEAFVERFVDKYPEHALELWVKLRRKAVV